MHSRPTDTQGRTFQGDYFRFETLKIIVLEYNFTPLEPQPSVQPEETAG
jgi:hypothetical protein